MALINFNVKTFLLRYPEFSGVDPARLPLFFEEAGDICANDASNPAARDLAFFQRLLYVLTAHITKLRAGACGDGGPRQLVGPISEAQEGTVRVSAAIGTAPQSETWFNQTQYGAQYLQMIRPWRSFRYYAPCNTPGWVP